MTRLHPAVFALLTAAAYLVLTLPILLHDSRNLSFFIIAGDYFVDPHTPIFVRPNSFGYDGQFVYRLAVAPFSFADTAAGIRFDVPVYRSQRFLYPLLAWIASAGQPGAAPAALFATNLAAIALLAGAALTLVRRLAFADTTAWAIAAWPGLLVSLTHDTTEIVAVAFLLSALTARAYGRLPLFALLGIAATLARETTAPVFAGLLLWDFLQLRRGGSWRPILADILAVIPLLAVHVAMPILWHQTASEGVVAHVFGWPLLGLARAVLEKIAAAIAAAPGPDRLRAALSLLALLLLFALATRAVIAAWGARQTPTAWLIASWLPTALLMAGLSEGDGAFVTPFEFGRVFSEFWPLSCLVIAAASPTRRAPLLLATATAVTVIAFTYSAFGI